MEFLTFSGKKIGVLQRVSFCGLVSFRMSLPRQFYGPPRNDSGYWYTSATIHLPGKTQICEQSNNFLFRGLHFLKSAL